MQPANEDDYFCSPVLYVHYFILEGLINKQSNNIESAIFRIQLAIECMNGIVKWPIGFQHSIEISWNNFGYYKKLSEMEIDMACEIENLMTKALGYYRVGNYDATEAYLKLSINALDASIKHPKLRPADPEKIEQRRVMGVMRWVLVGIVISIVGASIAMSRGNSDFKVQQGGSGEYVPNVHR